MPVIKRYNPTRIFKNLGQIKIIIPKRTARNAEIVKVIATMKTRDIQTLNILPFLKNSIYYLLYLPAGKIIKLSMLLSIMENTKEAPEKQKNVLENGTYSIYGPENGEIMIDKIELHSGAGAKRIWKVKSFSPKEIILEIEKFA